PRSRRVLHDVLAEVLAADPGYLSIRAASAVAEPLLRGFTTVWDVGEPVFGLKRAIDEGRSTGPWIYPSWSTGHGAAQGGCRGGRHHRWTTRAGWERVARAIEPSSSGQGCSHHASSGLGCRMSVRP